MRRTVRPLDRTGGRSTSRPRMVSLIGLLAVGLAAVSASPAGAHSDDGIMEVVMAEADGREITVEVGIVYADDGHLSIDAIVEASATGPDGVVVGPVDVPNDRDAIYATTFEVPTAGEWIVVVTSEDPEATATAQVTATEAPPEPAPTTALDAGPTPDEGEPTATPVPADAEEEVDGQEEVAREADDEIDVEADDDGDDDGVPAWLIVAIAVVALVAIAAVVALGRRSRGRPVTDDDVDPLGDETRTT